MVSVYVTMVFDEQFYCTYSKQAEGIKLKKKGTSELTCDLHTEHSFNVYTLDSIFYVYLFIVTRSGFQKCIGIGKVDNLALMAVMKKQETQSILFFPNCGYDTRSSSPIAAADINCDYKPKVVFACVSVMCSCRKWLLCRLFPLANIENMEFDRDHV